MKHVANFLVGLTLYALAGCAPPQGIENLNSTLWVQTSAEYRMAARQAYRAAGETMPVALGDPTWTAAIEQTGDFADKPPAIILDLDETVLDNGPFQAGLVAGETSFTPAAWDAWVAEASAAAVPGALDLIGAAENAGVTVFFVTNRAAAHEAATRKNLTALGVRLDGAVDTVLMKNERPGWGSDKKSRRAFLAADYRILMLFGDDLNDFMSGVKGAQATPAARLALADAHQGFWGHKWFIIPNPMYGSWNNALYGFDYSLDPAEIIARKYQALAPYKK